MKGVVFTEFLEMVEERYSLATVDELIRVASPKHGGTYTAVGTYPAEEMVALLSALAEVSKTPAPALLHVFGEHLFSKFVTGYPAFFQGVTDPLDFLSKVDSYIHVEVRKLYPDAELPRFEATRKSPKELDLVYSSPRCLSELAYGLIVGCGKHFGVPLQIAKEDLSGGKGEVVRSTIRTS
jgi:hypothetical protein